MAGMNRNRGLSALIPTGGSTPPTGQGFAQIAVELIDPNPHQPRTRFDEESLDELALEVEDVMRQPELRGRPGGPLERPGRAAAAPVGARPTQVILSPRLAWQTRLDSGMSVDIGREQQKATVRDRLQRFIEVYPETIGKRGTVPAIVDLRYPNGFAMRTAGEGKGK